MSKYYKPNSIMYKPTYEDWSGTKKSPDPRDQFGLVRVTLIGHTLADGMYRVCLWGTDDLGMEFDTKDQERQVEVFSELALEPLISFQKLLDMGFKYA